VEIEKRRKNFFDMEKEKFNEKIQLSEVSQKRS
jgi:hypothetical protein